MIVSLTGSQWNVLVYTTIIVLFYSVLENVIDYVSTYFSESIYRSINISMQLAVAKEIMRIDNKSLEVTSSGTFIQRLTVDTGTIVDAFYYMTYLTTDILRDIGIFIAIFVISKEIFIYALLTFLVIYIINYRKTKISGEKSKIVRQKRDKITSITGELVRGVRDVKMLNAETSFINELKDKVQDYNQSSYDRN